jgi:hypothetical protein
MGFFISVCGSVTTTLQWQELGKWSQPKEVMEETLIFLKLNAWYYFEFILLPCM